MSQARPPSGVEPQKLPGAEQATTSRKRGKRGNGRRIRRRIAEETKQRGNILAEDRKADSGFQSFMDLSDRLEKVDRKIAQLQWELHIHWPGEPGKGPAFDLNPKAAREFEQWRGLLDGRTPHFERLVSDRAGHGVSSEIKDQTRQTTISVEGDHR